MICVGVCVIVIIGKRNCSSYSPATDRSLVYLTWSSLCFASLLAPLAKEEEKMVEEEEEEEEEEEKEVS